MLNPAKRMNNIPFSGIRKVFEQARRMEKEGKNIIHLTIGRPDFDTPEHIKEAATDALKDGFVHYTSNYGDDGLLEAITNKLEQENGIRVQKGNIIVTVGANQALALAMLALLNPGDEVLVPDPGWSHYFYCTLLAGAKCVSYRLNEEDSFNINPEVLKGLITPKTKMLIVNSPHNPTGAVLSREVLEKIAEIANKYNLIVVSDEIYEKLLYDDAVHYSLATFPNMAERTLTVNGFSKAYSMTGWRIGYITGPHNFINAMIRVHQYTVTCATSFAQVGAKVALKGSQRCVNTMLYEFDRRRTLVMESVANIKGLSLLRPKGAFYAFINVKELGLNSEELAQYFLDKAGVAVIPGSVFGDYGEGYIRVAFSNSYENISEAMTRIADAINGLNN